MKKCSYIDKKGRSCDRWATVRVCRELGSEVVRFKDLNGVEKLMAVYPTEPNRYCYWCGKKIELGLDQKEGKW